jgi:RecA/RadA recombinase
VEVCGGSGSGKTYFVLKMVSMALLQHNVAVIYIDTSNYVNSDNMSAILKNYITIAEPAKRAAHAQQVLERLRVIKIFEVEELIMLLSMILS